MRSASDQDTAKKGLEWRTKRKITQVQDHLATCGIPLGWAKRSCSSTPPLSGQSLSLPLKVLAQEHPQKYQAGFAQAPLKTATLGLPLTLAFPSCSSFSDSYRWTLKIRQQPVRRAGCGDKEEEEEDGEKERQGTGTPLQALTKENTLVMKYNLTHSITPKAVPFLTLFQGH